MRIGEFPTLNAVVLYTRFETIPWPAFSPHFSHQNTPVSISYSPAMLTSSPPSLPGALGDSDSTDSGEDDDSDIASSSSSGTYADSVSEGEPDEAVEAASPAAPAVAGSSWCFGLIGVMGDGSAAPAGCIFLVFDLVKRVEGVARGFAGGVCGAAGCA